MELKAPSSMKLSGNLSENWSKFKQRFMLYLEASDKIRKPDKMKVALLLGIMGEECIDIFNSFKLSEAIGNNFNEVLNAFDNYFQPRTNTVIARYKFFNSRQKEGESVDSFVTNLKNLSKDCCFENQEDSLIRDLLVIGVRDSAMKEKLLMETELSLGKAIEYCRAKEASTKQIQIMSEHLDCNPKDIDAVKDKNKHGKVFNRHKGNNDSYRKMDKKSSALLGIEACEKMGFVHRKSSVHVDSVLGKDIVKDFHDVFTGKLGKLPYVYKIKLDASAEPKISAPKIIPYSLKLKVKRELDKMVDQGVIEKVVEPTDWVHPIVIVQKPNNQIRICMDPRMLNKYVKREHYPIPTQQSLFSQIEGEFFTVLDASSAFLQISLDEESSNLCTIATPFGRFRFRRLPYGLSSAPEVYQNTIESIFRDLEGILVYIDDILVFGKTEEEHDRRLKAVLNRAKEAGLKLSQEKSQIKQKSVKYLGYNLTNEGVSVNDDKIKAIVDFKAPTNKTELQRFLGMITYLGKFIENLSDRTGILRKLLSKKSEFVWTSNEQKVFENLKKCVSIAPVLAYYNPDLKSTVSVDASQYGLGAVLLQGDHPVCYASCALNDTQKSYSQIEKELLAVVNGCKKFHYFIYGTDTVVETDHKPLLGLLKKPIENLSERLQRMLFELLKYRIKLVYVPGKKLYVADALSRSPTKVYADTSFLEGGAATVHTILSTTDERTAEMQNAVKEDEDLSRLKLLIQNGWPKQYSQVPEKLRPYWNFKEELHDSNDLIFLGHRLVVPKTMQSYVLSKLHSAHQGITTCQNKAKVSLYWPKMNEHIKDYVERCQVCQERQTANQKETLMPYDIPKLPWEEVGVDFMYLDGDNFLQVIDYHSKFIELRKLNAKTATSVIGALKQIFRTHGIPQKIHSDNGPPFDSRAYLSFLKSYDIQPITSSPRYPRSNGMIERSIGTMKNILLKVKASGGDPNLAILEYNNTPKFKLPSPAEMLMGRRLSGNISRYKKKEMIVKSKGMCSVLFQGIVMDTKFLKVVKKSEMNSFRMFINNDHG
ncbi:uncharacterized protein K02A2.6-like [Uloborus diversus]|uniref:uncharacterized protein K02A2.6-like n=1 Tax=Uloborus diversus TaxID=327109 RepID=UPI002409D62A|nr:uncharacterized protein K02A2.6-like [Uloborus diversus]